MSCLSDENLAALVDGSADAEQTDAWNRHVDECDSCAGRLRRKQRASDQGETSDPATDPDATITVKPVGKPNLDAGGDQLPAEAIPGYRILKELHRGGQGVVYQAVQLSTKRKVALKVMLEGPFAGSESKKRFEREIALVGSLRHPNSGRCRGGKAWNPG